MEHNCLPKIPTAEVRKWAKYEDWFQEYYEILTIMYKTIYLQHYTIDHIDYNKDYINKEKSRETSKEIIERENLYVRFKDKDLKFFRI